MKNNIAVKVDHVSKSFRLPTEASSSLRTTLVNVFKGVKGYKEQKVLKDISFEVEKGDFFGIVGRNGSGKSTLLKIISQIYVPNHGQVTIDGKLVSFIELGVGFNPELTGHENVYLNGALLGFSTREIDEMYDDIVEFAELEDFMNQKLKNYSSGMQVRLAFSVAIQAKSDILVLDEILAVGDEAFQRKSREFFDSIKKDKSKTVILVTHDMNAVQRYCNKVIYIKDGILEKSENLQDITNQYSEDNLERNQNKSEIEKKPVGTIRFIANSKIVLDNDTDIFKYEVEYAILDESIKNLENKYLAISLNDEIRGGAVYDTGSMKLKNNVGKFSAEIPMEQFNNSEFRLSASIRIDPKVIDEAFFETDPVLFTYGDTDLRFIYRNLDNKHNYALLKEL